ncbi:C39 family peptidase [Lactococcus nasutitermitis]|uniref:C39 family peptidase n=1 Tax=Lactococcus nasutitermitis TaxID=1652957 RepID=A0ABV9JDV9_9LACT|nr:C39 family peptidase [Lactococcus nasutitermitis]
MNKKSLLLILGASLVAGISLALPSPSALATTSRGGGGVSLYRLYNSNSGEHFYTENLYEAKSLHNAGWNYEGIESKQPTSGAPVYRLYNPNAGLHFYTTNSYEKANLVAHGWRYEAIAFYSGGNVPLYRAYNPNSGQHNYTTSSSEEQSLTRAGWSNEGIAFQAAALGNPNDNTISRVPVWHPNHLYQTDPRWSNIQIGDATLGPEGCGPTSIAMILNGFGANYTPVTIAQTAHQIGDYNNPNYPGDGIDGKTILSTLSYYGMTSTHITTQSQLVSQLAAGKPVIYGMEYLYVYPSISHFVVLYGYNASTTTVFDPLGKITGAQSVSRLWSHPTQLSDDLDAGFPAWSVLPK